MKRTLLAICLLISSVVFSQTTAFPDFINYQAVLRDAGGTVLAPGTTGTLKFKIYDDMVSASATYEEDHNFTTNSVGMVILQIGKGTPVGTNTVGTVNWFGGKASYEVYMNGSLIGAKQPFATVPYAIFAKNSGNSLPNGLPNQTLYWDGAQAKWIPTSNLNNNGLNVGIGVSPGNFGNKLHVHSINPTDSSAILGFKSNANGRDAGIRGYAFGSTFSNLPNMGQAIYGADNYGLNNGTGPGIGVSGIGISSGWAYGVVGIASVNTNTAYAIGVYGGVASTLSPNSYAGYMDGNVFIRDSLYLGFTANPGVPGDVLMRTSTGKAKWQTLTGSSTINIAQGGIINVNPLTPATNFTISAQAPVFSSIGIGTIIPAAYPNYVLNVPTPTINFNSVTGFFNYLQGTFNSTLNLSPNLSLIGTTLSAGSSTVNLPGLNLWSAPSAPVVSLANSTNSVGIGTNTPSEKLHVIGNVMIPATNDYLYSGTKIKYCSVSSLAFNSENGEAYERRIISGHLYASAAGGTVNLPIGSATYFDAEISLPDGATVTAMDAFVVDNDASSDISVVQLWRSNSPVGSPFGATTMMGNSGPTSGASANIQQLTDNTIVSSVVDNLNYYYYIRFGGSYTGIGAAGQNIRLARFLITYIINKAD